MDIISRKKAKSIGLNFYFTGNPCPSGHICERYCSSYNCVLCVKLQSKKYYSHERYINKDKINARKRRYKTSNNKTHLKYRLKNKNKIHDRYKRYYTENKDKYLVRNSKRRAKKIGNGGSHTKEDVLNIYMMQKNRCAYCKCTLDKYHVDHIVPLCAGGTDDRSNLQILCPGCNLSKGRKHPLDFSRKIGLLI